MKLDFKPYRKKQPWERVPRPAKGGSVEKPARAKSATKRGKTLTGTDTTPAMGGPTAAVIAVVGTLAAVEKGSGSKHYYTIKRDKLKWAAYMRKWRLKKKLGV